MPGIHWSGGSGGQALGSIDAGLCATLQSIDHHQLDPCNQAAHPSPQMAARLQSRLQPPLGRALGAPCRSWSSAGSWGRLSSAPALPPPPPPPLVAAARPIVACCSAGPVSQPAEPQPDKQPSWQFKWKVGLTGDSLACCFSAGCCSLSLPLPSRACCARGHPNMNAPPNPLVYAAACFACLQGLLHTVAFAVLSPILVPAYILLVDPQPVHNPSKPGWLKMAVHLGKRACSAAGLHHAGRESTGSKHVVHIQVAAHNRF